MHLFSGSVQWKKRGQIVLWVLWFYTALVVYQPFNLTMLKCNFMVPRWPYHPVHRTVGRIQTSWWRQWRPTATASFTIKMRTFLESWPCLAHPTTFGHWERNNLPIIHRKTGRWCCTTQMISNARIASRKRECNKLFHRNYISWILFGPAIQRFFKYRKTAIMFVFLYLGLLKIILDAVRACLFVSVTSITIQKGYSLHFDTII